MGREIVTTIIKPVRVEAAANICWIAARSAVSCASSEVSVVFFVFVALGRCPWHRVSYHLDIFSNLRLWLCLFLSTQKRISLYNGRSFPAEPGISGGLDFAPCREETFLETALHVFVSFRGRGHGGLAPLATDLVACVAFAVLPPRAVGSHAKETLRGGFEAVVSISLLSYLFGPDTAQIR